VKQKMIEIVNIEIRRAEVGINGKWIQVPNTGKNPHMKVIANWLRENNLEINDPTGNLWVGLKELIDNAFTHYGILGEFLPVTAQLPVISRRQRIQV
jgi:hypothetical protein